MRCALLCAGLLAAGCGGRVDSADALRNLREQSEQCVQAMIGEDHKKMVELTHPTLVAKLGGPAEYLRKLEEIAAKMKAAGFRVEKVTFDKETGPVEAKGALYALLPQTVEMTFPDGTKHSRKSYLIGVSSDGGRRWTFLDGSGIGGDRAKLRMMLPDFPDELALP